MRAWLALFAVALAAHGCAHARCETVPEDVPVVPSIKVAGGFSAARIIEGLNRPTQMAFDEAGRLFVLEGGTAKKRVRIYDRTFHEISGFDITAEGESTGLLVLGKGETVWVASRGVIQRFHGDANLAYSAPETIVSELPSGMYFNNNLKLGPDGKIYFGLGSTCDACDEDDERSGAILRFDPRGTGQAQPEIYARGVRNAYDLIFTSTGELLATDNGPDCCPSDPNECPAPGADRLLSIKEDDHFGWPYIYRQKHDGGGMTIAPPLVELGMFAGAAGLVEYQGDIFVALWGQNHGTDEGGRKVVRVRRTSGSAPSVEPFLGQDGLGHPIALAVFDGRLYVLDYLGFILELVRS